MDPDRIKYTSNTAEPGLAGRILNSEFRKFYREFYAHSSLMSNSQREALNKEIKGLEELVKRCCFDVGVLETIDIKQRSEDKARNQRCEVAEENLRKLEAEATKIEEEINRIIDKELL